MDKITHQNSSELDFQFLGFLAQKNFIDIAKKFITQIFRGNYNSKDIFNFPEILPEISQGVLKTLYNIDIQVYKVGFEGRLPARNPAVPGEANRPPGSA